MRKWIPKNAEEWGMLCSLCFALLYIGVPFVVSLLAIFQ